MGNTSCGRLHVSDGQLEVEFKKWQPGFKELPDFGNMKERKKKRKRWSASDMFLSDSLNV